MSDVKAFRISQRDASDADGFGDPIDVPIEFENEQGEVIESRTITFLPPNSTEFTLITMNMASHNQMFTAVAASLDVVVNLIEDEMDRRWLLSALLDRDNPLDIEYVTDIVLYLVEEWTARPTREPSGSRRSPQRTGSKSTAMRHRKASTTRSASRPSAS